MTRCGRARKVSHWTKDETANLKAIYRNRSNKEVAQQLGRSVASVEGKAHAMELKKSRSYLRAIGRC